VEAARFLADGAATIVRARLRNWKVIADAGTGSPAKVILQRAREWDTQLIIAGSLGYNALERMLIGSVSHKIANEAHCSVRIARPAANAKSPLLLIGYDGHRAAELAVKAVAARNWAKGSRARLVMAIGFGPPARDFGLSGTLDRARSRIACAADMLKSAGLDVSTGIYQGDPRTVLIEQATDWGATCIFAGDNDESVLDRVVLGTVANALLARAPCSVEIVR